MKPSVMKPAIQKSTSSKRRARLSDEEMALWTHVAKSVKPLPGRRMPHFEPSSVKAVEARLDTKQAVDGLHFQPEPTTAPVAKKPLQPPLAAMERRMRQKISRGQAPVQGIIDLHGLRQEEAHRALLTFIQRKQHEGAAVVMVITGKGSFAPDGTERGVLKRLVPHWLADPGLRRCVIGYEDAARQHGGTGALYVRIRRIRD